MHFDGCVKCGTWKTDEHHIIKRRLGGKETISLCRKHHSQADRGKIDSKLLWSLLHDRNIGRELTDDYELLWELDYQRTVLNGDREIQFHDFYCEDHAICLYPPTLHGENRGFYRQCRVSLWIAGEQDLQLKGVDSQQTPPIEPSTPG